MKAIILARVSTEEQKEAGNSLPSQSFRLQKYCSERNLQILQEFNFDESAYKNRRAEFSKIVKLLSGSKEPIALCCDKIDRLIRNFTKDLATLEELRKDGKLELHFPSDNIVLHKDSPATDLFRFTIGVSLAKYYSDSIRDNVKRAFEQKLRKGEWIGPPRIGYIRSENHAGKPNHIPDPQKAHVIARMFELYATGNNSFKTIKHEMDDLGLVGKSGKPLSVSMVAHILQDPFYYGIMVSRGVEHPHHYQPLITRELFMACQAVRQGWNKKPTKYASKPYIFRGLLRCARCGCTMTPETKKGKYIFYSCTNAKGICRRIYVQEGELLKPILEVLSSIRLPEDKIVALVQGLKAANRAKADFHKKEIDRLEHEYGVLQNRIDGLPGLFLDGLIEKRAYDRNLKDWKDRQYECSSQIQDYTRADEGYHITVSAVLNLARRAAEIFESSEVPEKRQLLNYLLQNPRVDGKKLLFELKTPFDTIASVKDQPIGLPLLVAFRTLNWVKIRAILEEATFTLKYP